jgi:hypothetical protein
MASAERMARKRRVLIALSDRRMRLAKHGARAGWRRWSGRVADGLILTEVR